VTNVAGTLPIFVGANDLSTIPPAFLPYYTTSQGTSFSTPQVTGIVALMIEANPLLTPDQVVTLLRQTATPMPYEERVVGAGYVDAHNAVRAAMSLTAVPHPANLFPSERSERAADRRRSGRSARYHRTGYSCCLFQIRSGREPNRLPAESYRRFGPHAEYAVDTHVGIWQRSRYSSRHRSTRPLSRTSTERSRLSRPVQQNQETIGATDFGAIDGNEITIKLGLEKVNAAVGSNVLGTTSTNTQAEGPNTYRFIAVRGLTAELPDSGTGASFDIAPSFARPNTNTNT
jgi:hypothetical protein